MQSFFSQEMGQPLTWFGLGHLALLLGFFISIFVLNTYIGRIKTTRFEPYVRVLFLVLVLLFEFSIFQSRMLNGSIFRIPLCGIALYVLTYAVMFKKENVFKISYFYIFGTFLTYFFFDTPWGLDRWQGWTYFGSHAMIVYLGVYGYQVFGFKPEFKDLIKSMMYLAIYALISGYGTYNFGESDELFLFHAPVDFLNGILAFSQVLYVVVLSLMAIVLMFAMYIPLKLSKNK